MSRWKTSVALAVAAGLLAGCASSDSGPQTAAKPPKTHERTSPEPELMPTVPPGTFDRVREQSELAAARAARQAGNLPEAKTQAAAAVGHWPGDPAAWAELQAVFLALKEADNAHYAGFFHDKADYVTVLPPRIAALGFQNIAEEEEGGNQGGFVHDQRTTDTARLMQAFYAEQDTNSLPRDERPENKHFLEEHPSAGMVLFGAAMAALLTGAKEIK